MPTLREFQEQLDAAGIVDQNERNRRIAEAQAGGELELGPGEAEPQIAYEVPVEEPPPPNPILSTVGEVRSKIPTALDPFGAAIGGFGKIGQAPGARGVVAPGGTTTPGEGAAAKTEVAQIPLQPREKGEGAFESPAAPEVPQPGVQLPKVGMPGLGGIKGALAEQAETFERGEKRLRGATEGYQKAVGKWAEAEREGFEAEAAVRQEQREALELEQADMVQREQERQQVIDAEMTKVRDAVDTMKTAKIDPYRFYRHPDGSTNYPKSIAAAIAVGLGALGSSLPARYGGGVGGPNMALQIIDKAIDRDIQAQRDDIANKRAGIGLQMNLLSQMRAKFGDERQAESAARVVMLETYKMKIEETAARSKVPAVQANAQMLIAQADQKEAAELTGMQDRAAAAAVAGEGALFGARMQRANQKLRENMAMIKAMEPAKGKQLPANAVTKMADFRAGGGILSRVKREWNTKMKGKFVGGLAKNLPWSTEAKMFEDKTRAAAQFIGKKLEGRMTDEDYERILNMFPAPGDSDERAQQKFSALEEYLEAMEEATIRTYGETGYDISGFSKQQTKPTKGFSVK